MNKKDSPYTAAITGGGFLFEETNILLPLLRATNSEELLHDEKVNNRLLHINAESSRKKAILEIKRRYESMPSSFWDDFLGMNDTDKIVAIFYVILRTYKICFDFHVNVAIKKWNSISKSIDKNDIMMEFNEIASKMSLLIHGAIIPKIKWLLHILLYFVKWVCLTIATILMRFPVAILLTTWEKDNHGFWKLVFCNLTKLRT